MHTHICSLTLSCSKVFLFIYCFLIHAFVTGSLSFLLFIITITAHELLHNAFSRFSISFIIRCYIPSLCTIQVFLHFLILAHIKNIFLFRYYSYIFGVRRCSIRSIFYFFTLFCFCCCCCGVNTSLKTAIVYMIIYVNIWCVFLIPLIWADRARAQTHFLVSL